jgi:hypothetical protein
LRNRYIGAQIENIQTSAAGKQGEQERCKCMPFIRWTAKIMV